MKNKIRFKNNKKTSIKNSKFFKNNIINKSDSKNKIIFII